jgi:hypothetical protein
MLTQVFQYCIAALMVSSTTFLIVGMFMVLYYSNKGKDR